MAYTAGRIDKVEKLFDEIEKLINKFQADLPPDTEVQYSYALRFKSNLLAYRGELKQSYNFANQILKMGEISSNKRVMFEAYYCFGRLYQISGDLDKALDFFDQAINSFMEVQLTENERPTNLIVAYSLATSAAVEKNDLERARNYFTDLEDAFDQIRENAGPMLSIYKYAKAYLLKHSKRARDRVKAEELLREILDDKFTPGNFVFDARLYLSELLLVELRLSNDINVIDEINPVINEIIEFAQKSHFDYYIVEGYVLQAKLALLTFDIKAARRYLTQARLIAGRLGFSGLAEVVSSLEEQVMQQMDLWEQLEEENAPLSKRIELAGINDHLMGSFRTKMMNLERVSEEDLIVYKGSQTCLVCKGNAGGFNIFICPQCKSIYCKTCIEAIIELENECWSCDVVIDESKPVKSLEKKKEQQKISIDAAHKKKK